MVVLRTATPVVARPHLNIFPRMQSNPCPPGGTAIAHSVTCTIYEKDASVADRDSTAGRDPPFLSPQICTLRSASASVRATRPRLECVARRQAPHNPHGDLSAQWWTLQDAGIEGCGNAATFVSAACDSPINCRAWRRLHPHVAALMIVLSPVSECQKPILVAETAQFGQFPSEAASDVQIVGFLSGR